MNKILTETLRVGKTSAGLEICIDKYIVDTGIKGKTVYIQGGVHGGEVTLPIFTKLFEYLKSNLTSGKVVLIPFCNPLAWGQQVYCYTVGKFSLADGRDFNRSFGKEIYSLADKNASVLCEQIKGADFVIDLHTARESIPFGIVAKEDYLKYSKIANIEYTFLYPQTPNYSGTANDYATKNNIPNICIECGSHDAVNQNDIDKVFGGILSIFGSLKMIKSRVGGESVDCYYYTKATKLITEYAGIIEFVKQVGEKFKKGDVLYRVYQPDLVQGIVETRAEFDGVILKRKKTQIYSQYDDVLEVLKNEDLIKIV